MGGGGLGGALRMVRVAALGPRRQIPGVHGDAVMLGLRVGGGVVIKLEFALNTW